MTSVESLTQFVAALDSPSKLIVGTLTLLGVFAVRLFPQKTPVRVRLVVFSVLATLGGGTMLLLRDMALRAAPQARPEAPAAEAGPASERSSSTLPAIWDVAHAQSGGGWVFAGRWDEARRTWVEGPDLDGSGGRLPRGGESLSATRNLDLYDDQPRFNMLGQRWTLGRKAGSVAKGRRLKAQGPALLVGENVWVRVTEAP